MVKTTTALVEIIRGQAVEADDASLMRVGALSAHGDEEIAKLVFDAAKRVGKDGAVLIEESYTGQSFLEIVDAWKQKLVSTTPAQIL
jgi:chaperonin GroEL